LRVSLFRFHSDKTELLPSIDAWVKGFRGTAKTGITLFFNKKLIEREIFLLPEALPIKANPLSNLITSGFSKSPKNLSLSVIKLSVV